jgi:CxxC motif-containing protein
MKDDEITCILCPLGCKITFKINGEEFTPLNGYKCKQGIDYARSEALDPKRTLTSSMLIIDGNWPLVSVKTTQPIPKKNIFTILEEIKKTVVKAPVKCGDTLIKNVGNTNINVIATKTVRKKNIQ